MALHASHPLLIISSKRRTDDQEFSLEEAEKAHQWARHVYRLYGAEDAVSHVKSTTAHGYQEDKRELPYRAVERWLRPPRPKGDKELPMKTEKFEDLRCGLTEKSHTLRGITSGRVFAPPFLPTPPRGDAAGLRYPSPPSGRERTCISKLSNILGIKR